MNKHLKRLILVALTLTLALSCLPVFTAFAAEDDPAEEIIPAVLTIDSDKELFKKGESIPFVISGIGEKEELWITAPGQAEPAMQEGEFNDETVELSFPDSGKYTAYVVTWMGEESHQSESITFQVGKPTTATVEIDSDRTLFDVNEEIPFVVGGNGEIEQIWVIAPGQVKEALVADGLNDETYNLSFSVDGAYKVLVKSCMDDESLKSKTISFHVGKPTVADVALCETAPVCTVGSSLSFTLSSDSGECALTVVSPNGDELVLTPNELGIVTVTFSELGEYTLVNTATNEYGSTNPEEQESLTITAQAGKTVANPGKNENPATTTEQAPQPADYTWLIVPGIILALVLIIVLIVVVKINKKKKLAKAAQQ